MRSTLKLFRWFRAKWRVIRFYAPAIGVFARCFLDRRLVLSLGKYSLFDGHTLPVFFYAKRIPLEWISVGGLAVHETVQAARVRAVMGAYPERPKQNQLHGRAAERIYELVDARIRGRDDFVVLLERQGKNQYLKIDGATRLAVLAATGAEEVQALITLRGESRF